MAVTSRMEWLLSRRADAYQSLCKIWQFWPWATEAQHREFLVLQDRVRAFDTLLKQERKRERQAKLEQREQRREQARAHKLRQEQERQRRQEQQDRERQRERELWGLTTEPVTETEPEPVLPLPVTEYADTPKPLTHVIEEEMDRRARVLVSHHYRVMGRRHSRRYEGYRGRAGR